MRTLGIRRMLVVVEIAAVLAVAAGAYRVALRYLTAADAVTLIEWELKPAVMVACGYGFTQPGAPTPPALRFVSRKSPAISCDDFAWGGAPQPVIGMSLLNRYSIYGAGLAMRLRGVSWQALDEYMAFLFSASLTCLYGVFRMAAGALPALLGIVFLACSPVLFEIISLRDFVKQPCFAAIWLALAWVIARGTTGGARATLLPMTAAGAVVGLAIGLRMDALSMAPVFVAFVLFAVAGFSRRDWGIKVLACAAFAIAFLVAAAPILRTMSKGSNSAHFLVLGRMQPFDQGLSVQSAPYDIGAHYSDGYAYTVTVSHALLKQGAALPILLGSAEYDRVGRRFLAELTRQFPSDVMTRALGATAQTIRFPFDWRIRELVERTPVFAADPVARVVAGWRSWALSWGEQREVALVLAVCVLASAFGWRFGAIALVLTIYICGYSMLQFSRRHMFHLEAVPTLIAVLAVALPLRLAWSIGSEFHRDRQRGWDTLRAHTKQLAIGAAVVFGLIAAGAATLSLARAWQQWSAAGAIDATLAAEWLPEVVSDQPLALTALAGGQPTATWTEIFAPDPDRWRDAVLLRLDGVVERGAEAATPPDLRQRYFMVTLENRCAAAEVSLAVAYAGAYQTIDHEYIRSLVVPVGAGAPSRVLVPGFYHLGSTWNRLDGFAVPAAERACVTSVQRAADPRRLPWPVMTFVLAPDWREQPLYQRLLASPRVTVAGTLVGPRPDAASE